MTLEPQTTRSLRSLGHRSIVAPLARSGARVLGQVADFFTATSAAREFRRQGRDYLEPTGGLAFPAPARPSPIPAGGLPRALFVISTEVGGTPQTNQDLMSALSDRYETYVLRSDARSMVLTRWRGGRADTLHHVRLPEALRPFPHVDASYDRVLAGWLVEYGFSIVHIRHLAWHSLSLPRLARAFGVPVVFSFHDFYTICPTVRLVDENGVFCGGTCTATQGQCRHELWASKGFPPLKNAAVFRWRDGMAAMLADCDAFVTTSQDTRRRIQQFFPPTAEKPFQVIEHGRDFPPFSRVGHFPKPGERVRILVPGNISATKGAGVIKTMQSLDRAGRFEFHILGKASKELAGLPNVVCHGAYERKRFGDVVRGIDPHFGAVLSIWAETFCHTLTEMWACGLPVAAFDLGAVGDRIRRHGGGWLIGDVTPEAALAGLAAVAFDPAGFAARLVEVAAWQEGAGAHETCAWMADRYDALYRALLDGAPSQETAARLGAASLPQREART